eukprot:338236-Pyramimonas_sp.AAC.1
MEVSHAELQDQRELLKATPVERPHTAPVQIISDNGSLVAVAEEQQENMLTRGNPQAIYTNETHHVPLCSTDEYDSYGLDSGEH